jgi:hypothetical protein
MKKLFSIIVILIILTQNFTGCGSQDNNQMNEITTDPVDTTFKISNQSNYDLLQVNYASAEFGTVASSNEVTKSVKEGTWRIFFFLQSIEGNIYCRTSEVFTCEYGKNNELIISNITVIENTENRKIDTLKTIYDEMNTIIASLELRQSNTIINQFGEYDFGSIIKEKTSSVTFTIRNPGTVSLGLTGDPVVNSSNNIFTVALQPPNTVDARSSVHFILSYTPIDNQRVTSTITILNDGDVDAFTFIVKGIGRDYAVGDIGPAGGIIFYDAGTVVNGWRFLETAPSITETTVTWGGNGSNVYGTQTTAGTGKQNTQLIVTALNQTGETGKAAQICKDLVYNGYNDWFLPSRDELGYMFDNLKLKGLGGFGDGEYWSSSQYNNNYAWFQYFHVESFGFQSNDSKNFSKVVRAVRAF